MLFFDVLLCRNGYVSNNPKLRQTASIPSFFALIVLFCCFGCSGGSSSNSAPPSSTAPANLVYSKANLAVVAGQPIATNTPTVRGTVTSYSVTPALPAGLALNSSTGAISGTPTAVSPQANYTITATNSSGSTTATIQIAVTAAVTPPANLTYPQAAIAATVGQAIATDTPTVSGTVTSYAVSPSLPAGLNLDGTTGAISGTPTAVAAQASYTVTASNSAGSTTATIQITISPAVPPPPAPTNLVYPAATILSTVGQQITADIPTVTGIVASYAVSPDLPAGLTLASTNGVISGTPTTATPQATYTVTASNAGGSTAATLTITVTKPLTALLDLGHSQAIQTIRATADRVLSQDTSGHWLLSDYTSGSELASGDSDNPDPVEPLATWPVDIAGTTLAIGITNGLEIRSTVDGHLLTTIISPMIDSNSGPFKPWWKLASDGSYVCAGSTTGLSVWSPAGQPLLSKSGDYSKANVFAAPGEVRIALGPAGQNIIETISLAGGTSSNGPSFSGNFNTWFVDGAKFLTNLSTSVWTYSAASAPLGLASLSTTENLTGQGNWFWTYPNGVSGSPLTIYAVGSASPAVVYNFSAFPSVAASGTTIGLFDVNNLVSVIDLSSPTPSRTDYQLPIAASSTYAAISGSQWLIGNRYGVLLDGAGLPSTPRYLTRGEAWSIAGSSSRAAVATADGKITYFRSEQSHTPGLHRLL